jgi:hypothetical protein
LRGYCGHSVNTRTENNRPRDYIRNDTPLKALVKEAMIFVEAAFCRKKNGHFMAHSQFYGKKIPVNLLHSDFDLIKPC